MRLGSWAAAFLLASFLVGCGGAGMEEGIPKDALTKPPPPIPGVDLTKGAIQKGQGGTAPGAALTPTAVPGRTK